MERTLDTVLRSIGNPGIASGMVSRTPSPTPQAASVQALLQDSPSPPAISPRLFDLPTNLVITSLDLQNFIRYPIILSILWDYLPKPALQTAELKQLIKVEWLQDRLVLVKTLSLVSPVTTISNLVHILPLHRLCLSNFFYIGRPNDNPPSTAIVYRFNQKCLVLLVLRKWSFYSICKALNLNIQYIFNRQFLQLF